MAPNDVRKKLEQMKRTKNKKTNKPNTNNKNNPNSNVQDLRQLISRKKKTTNSRNDTRIQVNKVATGRVTKGGRSSNSNLNPRDLRETNKKLAAKKNLSQSSGNRQSARFAQGGPNRPAVQATSNSSMRTRSVIGNGGELFFKLGNNKKLQQQQYYVPPHMQHHQAPATFIIAPAAPPQQSNLAMDNVPELQQGASILISNLLPSITQSEIIELYGDIGVMTAVNMINQSTALVTYQNSSDAVKAVKKYHNRLLDGQPMFVHMMPNSTPTSNVRSRMSNSTPMSAYYGSRRI